MELVHGLGHAKVRTEEQRQVAKQVKVQTGRHVGNLVEIISGIDINQPLVETGAAFLSDNDLVKIVSSPYIKKIIL